ILGDNIFGDSLASFVKEAEAYPDHAWIALKEVPDPGRYGVAEINAGKIVGIEEKPAHPKSHWAVAGIYAYPADVFGVVKTLKPSWRNELEITDVNRWYLSQGRLGCSFLEDYWTDAGTLESLALANQLVLKSPPRF
ncbi:MAG TPA: sugar phosphate nucleotidyltransferase, partial [Gemmatales bacterium]|nr:sugar phosphate nucleotidyltransferase [Gemmatales bacterium]